MTIVFIGMIAWIVVIIMAVAMMARLPKLGADEDERRRTVVRSTVTIGAATAVWALSVAFSLWWNVIRFFLSFHPHR